jgi:hypothetical protein
VNQGHLSLTEKHFDMKFEKRPVNTWSLLHIMWVNKSSFDFVVNCIWKIFFKILLILFLRCRIYDIQRQSEIRLQLNHCDSVYKIVFRVVFVGTYHIRSVIYDYWFEILCKFVFWMGPLLYLSSLLIYNFS